MTNRRTLLRIVAVSLLTVGCGSSRYTVIEPPKESVRDFTVRNARRA
jgi:hypothetical protein